MRFACSQRLASYLDCKNHKSGVCLLNYRAKLNEAYHVWDLQIPDWIGSARFGLFVVKILSTFLTNIIGHRVSLYIFYIIMKERTTYKTNRFSIFPLKYTIALIKDKWFFFFFSFFHSLCVDLYPSSSFIFLSWSPTYCSEGCEHASGPLWYTSCYRTSLFFSMNMKEPHESPEIISLWPTRQSVCPETNLLNEDPHLLQIQELYSKSQLVSMGVVRLCHWSYCRKQILALWLCVCFWWCVCANNTD